MRNALLAGGGLALAGIGLAAGLYLKSPAADPAPSAPLEQPAAIAAAPADVEKVDPPASTRKVAPSRTSSGRSTPMEVQPVANACTNCGVIESVRSFQRKGEGSGVGAVAGGVIGGALGNQVGKGSGRAAMTVLGAVGGGMAGHEIEKRTKSETLYEVRVRMDDGSLRTVTQKTQPTPGSRVVVEGESLRQTGGHEPQGPRTIRVSAPATGA
jgi:outer membrane lipoprotein SlyB